VERARPEASQSLPFWPHAVAAALALVALGYATGRVRAPATAPEPTVAVPERGTRPALATQPAPPEPQVNVPIFELAAGPTAQPLEWPNQAARATFVLRVAEQPPRDEYALRVRAHDGAPVLSALGLKRTRSGSVTLAVPRRMMPRGSYVFELLAAGSKPEDAALASFAVEIR
jgi:hypothetical protein